MSKPFQIGERNGRLTIVQPLDLFARGRQRRFRCVCDCGNEKVAAGALMRAGKVWSCGCLRQAKAPGQRVLTAKTCEMCGSSWLPANRHQADRNSTCGFVCRSAFIAQVKGRKDDEVRSVLAAKSTAGPGGCTVWNGRIDGSGYGRLSIRGRMESAHRAAYVLAKGPIPAGLCLDHLCRVRACINPEHLEAVTHLENVRRGARATQTHCLRGHPFDDENTIWRGNGRHCRACRRMRSAARRAQR